MSFENGRIKGEGTDYVGPWTASGSYDVDSGVASWVKVYLGKHTVEYRGQITDKGILGEWTILGSGTFHIWPRGMGEFNELYLKQDLEAPASTQTPEPAMALFGA